MSSRVLRDFAKGNGWRDSTFFVGMIDGFGWYGDDQRLCRRLTAATADQLRSEANSSAFLDKTRGTRSARTPREINFTLSPLAAITFITTAYVFFRCAAKTFCFRADDEVAIRSLLKEYGERDSLGYFATRRDKSADWSPTGRAVVTYRVVFGVSLRAPTLLVTLRHGRRQLRSGWKRPTGTPGRQQ